MTLSNTPPALAGFLLAIITASLTSSVLANPANSKQNTQCTTQQYRPRYHFSPANHWINDPNGMIYYDGVYHLYYQYHPNSSVWGPMHWGHSVSPDLITWEEKGIALYPDELGDIFSGSSVLDNLNTTGFKNSSVDPIVAIYTNALGNDHSIQRQSVAYSLDGGDTFIKYKGNPVLADENKPNFRDPKVFFHDGRWVMSLAVEDRIEFFTSPNLLNWTIESEFGRNPKLGVHDGVWECPDLLPLNVDINDKLTIELWALLVSINPGGPNQGSATQYFIGNFTKNSTTNKLEFNSFDWSKSQWLDWGPDNYAGVTFSNEPTGRFIYIAWLNNWDYANNLPTDSWRGQMTIPRELSLRVLNHTAGQYRLVSTPVKELEHLRNPFQRLQVIEEFTLPPQAKVNLMEQAGFESPTMEFAITLNVTDNAQFSICPHNSENEETCFGFNGTHWYLDRSKSGNVNFHANFNKSLHAYAIREIKENIINIRIYLDVSSIEVFADDGLTTFTALHFPSKPFDKIYLNHWSKPSSRASLTVNSFSVWGLHCWYPEVEESPDSSGGVGVSVSTLQLLSIMTMTLITVLLR